MDKKTEREVAKGLKEGDRQAWIQLYEAYSERIWENIARIVGCDSSEVADIVQETFMASARSAKNFNPRRGSLWIWLCGIAKKQIALYYRKQKPTAATAEAKSWWINLDEKRNGWIDVTSKPPQDVLEAKETAALVRVALNELSAEYQTLLLAKYVDNQPAKKIANDMACSYISVRSKLARARKAFRVAFRKLTRATPQAKEVSL